MARWLVDAVRTLPPSDIPVGDVLSLVEIAFEDADKFGALPPSLTHGSGYGPVSAVVHLRRELAGVATLAAELVATYDPGPVPASTLVSPDPEEPTP